MGDPTCHLCPFRNFCEEPCEKIAHVLKRTSVSVKARLMGDMDIFSTDAAQRPVGSAITDSTLSCVRALAERGVSLRMISRFSRTDISHVTVHRMLKLRSL